MRRREVVVWACARSARAAHALAESSLEFAKRWKDGDPSTRRISQQLWQATQLCRAMPEGELQRQARGRRRSIRHWATSERLCKRAVIK